MRLNSSQTRAGKTWLNKNSFEMQLIQEFLPRQMDEAELQQLIVKAISDLKPAGMQDMGKVMAAVKTASAGLADMALASALVKKTPVLIEAARP